MIANIVPSASDLVHFATWTGLVLFVVLIVGVVMVVVQSIIGVVFGDDEVRL